MMSYEQNTNFMKTRFFDFSKLDFMMKNRFLGMKNGFPDPSQGVADQSLKRAIYGIPRFYDEKSIPGHEKWVPRPARPLPDPEKSRNRAKIPKN